LWSRSFTPSPSPFDSLIREALIEQRASSTTDTSTASVSRWDKDAHALLWLLANDLDLVFCVAYQRILSLPYVADLLEAVRKAFLRAYRDTVQAIVDSSARGKDVLVAAATSTTAGVGNAAAFALFGKDGWQKLFEGWDETFSRILRDFEASAAKVRRAFDPFPPCPPAARRLTPLPLPAEQEAQASYAIWYRRRRCKPIILCERGSKCVQILPPGPSSPSRSELTRPFPLAQLHLSPAHPTELSTRRR